MATTELYHLSIHQAGPLLRSRQLSPVELTRAFLERSAQLDPTLQAYITVLPAQAMAAAQSAEAEILRGDHKGPLHGIPIALKDLYDTKGIRTTASSRVMADRTPTEDATATARLRAAGTILLGKLAMHEFALGGPDPTCGFPLARNPWNLDYIPGGSSSGSGAAVAAGLCMGSLGSCTGGSIRGPAAYCSIVGLKATYGRVSRYGVVPLSWSLDHCGPMTWTVEDCAIMLGAIAGYDPKDPTTSRAPVPAFQEVDAMTTARRPSFTGPYNLTGMPAISVPCGFTSHGLPIGLQIAGKPFDEPTVLRVAYTYQQAARWFEKRPPEPPRRDQHA
jgi:aspartyl-tRNA(Asn)/glutamyl-tRNA(Gln) amidotransferase subunit A